MTFDKTKPAGSDELRNSDDMIRDNWAALETALSEGHEFTTGGDQTGKHTTPTFRDNSGDPSQPTSTNEVTLYNDAATLYTLNDSGLKRSLDPIPQGTKMLSSKAVLLLAGRSRVKITNACS